jgi:hypothetical protein
MDLPTGAGDSQENTDLNDEIMTAEKIIEEVRNSLKILDKNEQKWNQQCIEELMSVDKWPSIGRAKNTLTVARTDKNRTKAIGDLRLAYNGYIEKKKAEILKCKNRIASQTPNHLQRSKTPAKHNAIETNKSNEFQELEDERERLFRTLSEYDDHVTEENREKMVQVRLELETLKVKYNRMWKHNAFERIPDLKKEEEEEYATWNADITSLNEKVAVLLEAIQEEERRKARENFERIRQEKEEKKARLDRLLQEIETKKIQTEQNAFKFKSTPDIQKLYKILFKFGRKLANESKKLIYYIMQKNLRLADMQDDLCKLGSSCTFLCENKGNPYNINDTSHQVLRSFLHMNDRSLQAIIWAYLQLYYGLCEETDAFTVLLCAIEYEVFHRYKESEAWDVMTSLGQNTARRHGQHRPTYLQLYYGLCEETDAFTVLLCAIEYEVFHRYKESEAWDVMTSLGQNTARRHGQHRPTAWRCGGEELPEGSSRESKLSL